MRVVERIELADQPLGMHPAQAMAQDVELPGIVADNEQVRRQTVRDRTG
jgi:hypothetical protein